VPGTVMLIIITAVCTEIQWCWSILQQFVNPTVIQWCWSLLQQFANPTVIQWCWSLFKANCEQPTLHLRRKVCQWTWKQDVYKIHRLINNWLDFTVHSIIWNYNESNGGQDIENNNEYICNPDYKSVRKYIFIINEKMRL